MDMTPSSGEPSDAPPATRFSPELMHAVATLYYLEDATQAEVASRLNTSRATVSRLLSEARRLGIVRIEVRAPGEVAPDLGPRVAAALGLAGVHVAPAAHPTVLGPVLAPLLAGALAGAGLAAGEVLLVSSGRTVWEVAHAQLPSIPGVVVAPTVGGQDEPEAWYQTNEITRMVAEKVGGRPTFLYAPALPGPHLHERMLEDAGIRRVIELWGSARCALLGVGAPASGRRSLPGFVDRNEPWLQRAAGDICTRFYESTGEPIDFPGADRLIAIGLRELRQIPVTIALAVGMEKIPSLLAGARAGWFNTLVTDTPTATALLVAAEGDAGG
jgi:DNA-binding transcriptional regulator LsrR (DeoR family)